MLSYPSEATAALGGKGDSWPSTRLLAKAEEGFKTLLSLLLLLLFDGVREGAGRAVPAPVG